MYTQAKKFVRFRYAAIRRYGDRRWTANDGYCEINPNYTVAVSSCELGIVGGAGDFPFVVELSNGTKYIIFLHEYGDEPKDVIFSEQGEEANTRVNEDSYIEVVENINRINRY